MQTIKAAIAFYPAFHLGCEPQAIECELRIVEANGKRYLKTPFAMLNAYDDDEIERQFKPEYAPGYYRTSDACMAYLAREYPWWKQAAPLMDALCDARRHYGNLVGPSRIADTCDVSTDELYRLARGHKGFTLKGVKDALRRLSPVAA
jgi:hypothetical protein